MSFLIRILLLFVLAILAARAFWRFVAGVIQAAQPPPPSRSGPPGRGVRMVRDPVCGTFLPPADALTAPGQRGDVLYFCSEACRRRFESETVSRRS